MRYVWCETQLQENGQMTIITNLQKTNSDAHFFRMVGTILVFEDEISCYNPHFQIFRYQFNAMLHWNMCSDFAPNRKKLCPRLGIGHSYFQHATEHYRSHICKVMHEQRQYAQFIRFTVKINSKRDGIRN